MRRELSGGSSICVIALAQEQENAPTQPISDQLVHNSVGPLDSIAEEDDGEEDEESDLDSLPSLHEVSSSSSESESLSSDSDSDGEVDSDEESDSMPALIPSDEQENSCSDDSSDEELSNNNSRRSSRYNLHSKSRAKHQNRQSRRKSAKISAERKEKNADEPLDVLENTCRA